MADKRGAVLTGGNGVKLPVTANNGRRRCKFSTCAPLPGLTPILSPSPQSGFSRDNIINQGLPQARSLDSCLGVLAWLGWEPRFHPFLPGPITRSGYV